MAKPRRWKDRLSADSREDGQILLLSIVYGVLALVLVTVVISASSVHLERKRLLALADHAALAAADALDADAYYARGDALPSDGGLVLLTSDSVRSAAQGHLDASPATGRLTDIHLAEATSPEGRTARVTLTATSRPPLAGWAIAAWSDGVALQVTASARAH